MLNQNANYMQGYNNSKNRIIYTFSLNYWY